MKRILILIIFFYILALLQTSFLIYFNIKGKTPNLILISAIIINFLEKPKNHSGLWSSAIGGFFFDVFSGNFIGFHILIFLGLAIFIKFILRKYVRIPLISRF